MNRVCPCLLLPLLAIAACKTERKPLIGFDEPPPGSFILGPWNEGNAVRVWPIFDLPNRDMFDKFRFRLNDQVVVYMTSDEGFYDYATAYLQGWTSNGFPSTLGGTPNWWAICPHPWPPPAWRALITSSGLTPAAVAMLIAWHT